MVDRGVEVDALERRPAVRKVALHDLSEMVEWSNLGSQFSAIIFGEKIGIIFLML
jgi:hypothetical protein